MDAMVKPARPFSAADYSQLKSATKRATEAAGPLVEIARRTRIDAATISRAGNHNESNYIPIDVAIDMDRMSGDAVILRTMARALGYRLVPVDAPEFSADLRLKAGHVARESGELIAKTLEALSDGELSPREAMEIDHEAADVEHLVAGIRRHVHGVVAK